MKKLLVILCVLLLLCGCSKKFNVTINYNNDEASTVQQIEQGKTISKLADPKKEGYVFNYWEVDGKEYDFTQPVEKDFTLNANYSKLYTVTFMADGKVSGTISVKENAILANEANLPIAEEKENYEFVCWQLNGQDYDMNTPIKADLELVANYIEHIETKEIKVKNEELTIELNQVGKIEYTLTPENTTEKVTFTSEDEKIAIVDEKGTVTPVAKGETYIVVSTSKVSVKVKVIVKEISVAVSSIAFEKTSLTIARNATEKLNVTIAPENASDKTITYTSKDSKIAKVDSNGNITAVAKGKTTITATSANGKTTTCEVEVFVKVESITISADRNTIAYNGVKADNFKAKISPSDADITTVNWQTGGNVGGQNGSYSFEVKENNIATLIARENSRYDKTSSVYAYVTNKDGSIIKSNTITITAEETLSLTKKAGENVTWKFEDGKYIAICPNNTNLEIKANADIVASFNNENYIDQKYNEGDEVWITVSNTHEHAEGFVMTITTLGGQQVQVSITVNPSKK